MWSLTWSFKNLRLPPVSVVTHRVVATGFISAAVAGLATRITNDADAAIATGVQQWFWCTSLQN
jgi:hypothetical protein